MPITILDFNVPFDCLVWPAGNIPRTEDDTDVVAKLAEPLGYVLPNVPYWALLPIAGDEDKPDWLQRVPTGTEGVSILRYELFIRRFRPDLRRLDMEGGRIGATELACTCKVAGKRAVMAFVAHLPQGEPFPGQPMSLGSAYVVFEDGTTADGHMILFSKPTDDNEFSRRFNLC